MTDSAPDVCELLEQIAKGSKEAEATLIPLVYGELRRIARRLMRREHPHHTLQTTALVHEAYLRLARPEGNVWKDRTHFFAVAATVMRRILVDHARARRAEKRGGGEPLPLDFLAPSISIEDPERILAIDSGLRC